MVPSAQAEIPSVMDHLNMSDIRFFFLAVLLALGAGAALPSLAIANERSASSPIPATGTVRLLINRAGGGKVMDVRNGLDTPVEVRLRLSRLVNVAGVGRGLIRQTIPARSQMRLTTLRKRDAAYPIIYRHSFSYTVVPTSTPQPSGSPDGYAYALPWKGGPFRISQGAGGDYSHTSAKGRYAVDIAMPVGTPIVAARSGTVVETRNNQAGRRPHPAGNFVRIRHADGTDSAYLHLSRGSVQVRPGQSVKVGALLARSGNTGRSTGPHLHFVVQKPLGDSLVSIPFRFAQPVDSLPNFAMSKR